MIRLKVFVSSVQKEMENERQALKAYLRDDALLCRFFDVFLFEDLPAADRRADAVYLAEVGSSDIYVALLGNDYGREDRDGLSPTHREFCEATRLGKASPGFRQRGNRFGQASQNAGLDRRSWRTIDSTPISLICRAASIHLCQFGGLPRV